jgi:hypothetical protein
MQMMQYNAGRLVRVVTRFPLREKQHTSPRKKDEKAKQNPRLDEQVRYRRLRGSEVGAGGPGYGACVTKASVSGQQAGAMKTGPQNRSFRD